MDQMTVMEAERGSQGWKDSDEELGLGQTREFNDEIIELGEPEALRRAGETGVERVWRWSREGGAAALAIANGRFRVAAWTSGKKEPYFVSEGPEGLLGESEGMSLREAWQAFLSGEQEEQERLSQQAKEERPAWESW